jgi:beta-glucosidase
VLRDELGFKGLLVTDYNEINNLYWWHHAAHSPENAIEVAMQKTTIDMSMVATSYNFSSTVSELVSQGKVDKGRIALSCARNLQLKKNLGLFTDPFPPKSVKQFSSVGSSADRQVALDLARESVTLLKNAKHDSHPVLPLSKSARVLLTGPSSDSLRVHIY